MKPLKDKIEAWLQPKLQELDLFLVDISISPTHKIGVFIDKNAGVSIDECVSVSRFLEPFLDEDQTVNERYNLEVSSPGLTQPLKVPQQYQKQIGKPLQITTLQGETHKVELLDADINKILVKALPETTTKKGAKKKQIETPNKEETSFELDYLQIKKAIVHFTF